MDIQKFLIPAFAGAGLAVSILALADIALPCQTSGCSLYAGIKIAGVSPYALGAAGFTAILAGWAVSLFRQRMQFLLRWLLVAGMAISSAFLAWQNLYWPCTTCLVIALAMALAAGAAWLTVPSCRTWPMTAVLVLWTALFLPALASAAKESLLTPTPLVGSAQAPVKIFFSPTCPACQRVVTEALENRSLAGNLALIPVAKGEEDLRRLAGHFAFNTPVAELFSPVEADPPPLPLPRRLELARNKMVLAGMGAGSVPVVISPRLVSPAPARQPSGGSLEEYYLNLFPDQNSFDPGCNMQAPVESTCPQ